MSPDVVIVGASLGGLRAAEQLRAAGWTGGVTVVGSERHMPYNRPPLSKEVLRAGGAARMAAEHAGLAFRVRPSVAGITWRLGVSVVSADLDNNTVTLSNGTTVPYAGLVVATGLRPRRLAVPGPERGRYVLRTLDDARLLRKELVAGARVVVIGAGFIGCEVAATAARLGCEVAVVEPAGVPMARALGQHLGAAVQRYHEREGVRFHLGRTVLDLQGADAIRGVELDDGTRLGADVLVESIGSRPNVEWLAGNGLDLSDGVLCDNDLRIENRPNVVGVGDVARFPNAGVDGVPRRVEHWCVPGDTARRAARTLVCALTDAPPNGQPFAPLVSFWTDQFDLRIQGFGAPSLADEAEVLEGDLSSLAGLRTGVVVGYRRQRRLVGVVLVNLPARTTHYRALLTAAASVAA